MTLMTQKFGVNFTYRRIDVKYWSRKSLACSSITSGLRASVVINGKFAPCTMLPMQMAREHANALLGVCWKKKKKKKNHENYAKDNEQLWSWWNESGMLLLSLYLALYLPSNLESHSVFFSVCRSVLRRRYIFFIFPPRSTSSSKNHRLWQNHKNPIRKSFIS